MTKRGSWWPDHVDGFDSGGRLQPAPNGLGPPAAGAAKAPGTSYPRRRGDRATYAAPAARGRRRTARATGARYAARGPGMSRTEAGWESASDTPRACACASDVTGPDPRCCLSPGSASTSTWGRGSRVGRRPRANRVRRARYGRSQRPRRPLRMDGLAEVVGRCSMSSNWTRSMC